MSCLIWRIETTAISSRLINFVSVVLAPRGLRGSFQFEKYYRLIRMPDVRRFGGMR